MDKDTAQGQPEGNTFVSAEIESATPKTAQQDMDELSIALSSVSAEQPQPAVSASIGLPVSPPRKSHKGLVVGVLALVMLLIGLCGGALYYYDNYTLKSDYDMASDVYHELHPDDFNKMVDVVHKKSTSDMSDKELADMLHSLKSFDASANKMIKDFAPLRANKDTKVRDAYETFKKQYGIAMPEMIGMMESVPQGKKLAAACGSISTDKHQFDGVKTGDEAATIYTGIVKPCIDAALELRKSHSETISSMASSYVDVMQRLIVAIKNAYNVKTLAQLVASNAEVAKINKAMEDIVPNMKVKQKALVQRMKDFPGTAHDLEDAIDKGRDNALI